MNTTNKHNDSLFDEIIHDHQSLFIYTQLLSLKIINVSMLIMSYKLKNYCKSYHLDI